MQQLALCALWTMAFVQVSGLDVLLSSVKKSFAASETVLIDVTLRNLGLKPAQLLQAFSPLNGNSFNPLFRVTLGQSPVQYVGPLGKVSAEHFITIGARNSSTGKFDLTKFYDFPLSGNYTIQYDVAERGLFNATDPNVRTLVSNVLTLTIAGRPNIPALVRAAAPVTAMAGSSGFVQCSFLSELLIYAARASASAMARDSASYLAAQPYASTLRRYTTWFGKSQATYGSASDHFWKIANVIDNVGITFDCSYSGCPGDNIYAFVYRNQPYTIHLCKLFWNAGNTGTDSKAGTIIHELSHFIVVADTSDHAYGQTAAKNLANNDPGKAVANADSHEYFAENNPSIPREGDSGNWRVGAHGYWASGCDFKGDDMGNARSSADQCSTVCKGNRGCTHYSWTPWNGGTCWMKANDIHPNDAFSNGDLSVLCGINSAISWNGNWASSCAFKGHDLSNTRTPASNCGPSCQATPGCTHFVWT